MAFYAKLTLSFAFLLMASSVALAQNADLSRATCAQIKELAPQDQAQVLFWLHAYYAGAAQRPNLDRAKVQSTIEATQAFCDKNPNSPIIGAEARDVFLGEAAQGAAPATQGSTIAVSGTNPAIQQNNAPQRGAPSRPQPVQ
jgi:hypothetical protein